jgi:hypothetical protein
MTFWMKTRSSILVHLVVVLIFTWIGMIVFIDVITVINLLNPTLMDKSKETKTNQKLESSKTSQKIKPLWTIDYINNSDIGYPEEDINIDK